MGKDVSETQQRSSASISEGKLMEERFYCKMIPSIVEKPVRSLGRWYNSTLGDPRTGFRA